MLAAVVAAALICPPQETPRPRVATSPHGWPVAERSESSGDPSAAAAQDGPSRGKDARGLAPEPGGFAAQDRVESTSLAVATPAALLPVFRAVGTPADAAGLGGVSLRVRITIFDHRGATLSEREIVHEADLRVAARDRLLRGGDTVYGRDGDHVFAHYRGISFPNLEAEARNELAWFGRALRAPWLFADETRYVVQPREELLLNGRPMSRFRIASQIAGSAAADQFELWCDPDTSEPRLLLIKPADPAARPCRIRLLEFRSFGNARVPMRRVVEGPDGNKTMELEVLDLAPQQPFPRRHFTAPAR